jgi:hypothetical protein
MAIEFDNYPMGMMEFLAATRENRWGLLAFGPTFERPAPLGPTGRLLHPLDEAISLDLLLERHRLSTQVRIFRHG